MSKQDPIALDGAAPTGMRPLPTTPPVVAATASALGRRIGRRPRPASFSRRQSAPPQPLLLLQSQRAFASGGATKEGKEDKEEESGSSSTNETAHFNVVAAEARSDPSRRFTISTDGERRQKVPVFRDLTRNRESFRERVMEHDTFTSNLPRALQQYEEEQEMARKQGYARNPLVRDQATLIIDKGDASNRRWLSGAPEGAGSSSWAEREVLAQKERLKGVEGTIVRRRAGLGAGIPGDTGLPDEGLSVEEKIQLAMAQGDFDNLAGKGKPLERYNSEGQYFEDRTSHRFMETLHRAGVKPVWVDRAGRIKQMHATLRRRAEAEWARLLLDESTSSIPASAVPRLQDRWRTRLENLRSLEDDLGFVNAEIDLYNLQVPSLSLQRVRLRLDYLTTLDAPTPPPFLSPTTDSSSYIIDTAAAAAFLRAAERDGVMSSVTALGILKLEAQEDRARQEKEREERGRGRWSVSGGGSGGSGGGGLFGSITSWFTGGGGKK